MGLRGLCGVFVGLMLVGPSLSSAQVTETPVPFDSAGSVRAITLGLAERLMLSPPVWPVTGAFDEARLYAVSGGEFVLVVHLAGGVIQRYPLTASTRDALQRAVDAAMTQFGRVVGEESSGVISEPARGAFIRNQMLLTAFVYAPAAASLTHDGKAGTAVWLLATGGSYFALSNFARKTSITKAQNHLATDGGLRGALLTNGLLYTFGVDMSADIAIGAGLAGAIGGAVTGFRIGRRWTDSEASATTAASSFAALTAFGLSGAAGILGDSGSERLVSGIASATGALGYALGRQYPRRAGYRVTAGDIGILQLTSLLGVGVSAIPFISANEVNARALAGSLTVGMLAGVLVGDITLVRRYDHTTADAARVTLGALAGGLLGGGVVVLAEPAARSGFAMVVAGAITGTILAERVVGPARANSRGASDPGAERNLSVNFDPTGAVAAALGVPGWFPVLSVRF